ncbi:MFS transporter [Nonomuraea rhodomycinica]|uniref:MFS transporter n=1 Tax=Nonomuraea rhodomycinica TaxID=1712872 RepID=A0A7Y6IQN4_9ACTN|nr:MFS transporter [Nonomuraea rhodomycinica]NUW42310.1 MFS transporter [Nonomuraea rhodomycinica]
MTSSTIGAPPRARGRAAALLGVSLGYFMVLLDMTVLSVAEPDLAASLRTSIAGLQWATTGYTVVFGALLLSGGAVADRYGADRVFRAGVAVFALGSLLSALAPGLGVLVGLRAVLGAAGAACVPASMAVIARLYPDPGERTRAVAAWAAISGAAVAAGPVAGGALVDLAGWRAIFLVNVPIGVLVLALTALSTAPGKAPGVAPGEAPSVAPSVAPGAAAGSPRGERRIDWAAQLAACAVLALLTDALIAAGSRSWAHAAGSAAATALAARGFAALERRSHAPVLNRALLGSGGVRAGLAAGAAVSFTLNGALFVLPLLLQQGRHLSAVASGLAFLPLTLPFAVNPPLTGRIVARVGPRPPILAGLALLAAGGGGLAWAVGAGAGYGWLAVGLLLTGTGVSLVLPALAAAVIAAAPAGTAGAAGGLLNAVRQTGATVGVAVMGACAGLGTVTGTALSLVVAAALCGLAAAWFARRSSPGRSRAGASR